MRKTAHIARRFAFDEWGGTESVIWNTAKAQRELGIISEIVATKALCPLEFEERENIAIHRFNYYYPYWPLSKTKREILDKKGGNPYVPGLVNYLTTGGFELLHCHAMGRVAGAVRLASQKAGIPYVISFHGGCFDIPESEMKEMLKPLRHTVRYGAITDRIKHMRSDPLAAADGLICVGRNELELTRSKYPDKMVEYIPNGADIEKFATVVEFNFKKSCNIPENRKIMLSVSRIDYQKNQIFLLDILAKMPAEWHLVLIGAPTAEWYAEKIKRRISELKLENRTTIIPGVPPDSPMLPAAYQSAQLFVLPSIHEPFGIVILEAWSANLPVIAAPVGGINHLIDSGHNGFLCRTDQVGSVDEWVTTALKLTGNLRENITKNATHTVRSNYSWKSITNRLMDFYDEISARRKNKA